MRRRNKVLAIVLAAIIMVVVGFIVWAETPLGPMPEALTALQSDSLVNVSTDKWLIFQPQTSKWNIGFIIYPGGRVDYRAYAPAAHAIAAEGYLTIIVPMPLNLAVFGADRADEVINAYSEIRAWAIGGHSLGGTMAAQFASKHPSTIKGLVLWASYPSSGNDLSKQDIRVITIHGSKDGLVSSSQIENSLQFLPPDTIRVEILGGNHAQFGWYGSQLGDNDATISRELQQLQLINATLQLLGKLSEF